MKNIIAAIKSIYPVSDRAIKELTLKFSNHHFPKHEVIIRGRFLDRKVYFIEQGIIFMDEKFIKTDNIVTIILLNCRTKQ